MTHITLSAEQSQLLYSAAAPIVFLDARGREVGRLNRPMGDTAAEYELSADELAELHRRESSPGPGVTTSELLARLQSLAPIEGP